MKLIYRETNLAEVALDFLAHSKHKINTFQGDMGAGKTTLIKAICKSLGVENNTSSPTFSLVNEYHLPNKQKIYHFDFYRLKSETEALDMGIDEYLDSGSWCFIEWPEKIPSLLNMPHTNIKIEILPTDERLLTDFKDE